MMSAVRDGLHRAPPRWRALFAVSAGAISALAMPPFSLWPLLALTLTALVLLLDAAVEGRSLRGRLWPAFATGWLFGMGYFLAGLWWIGQAFLVQADDFAWLLPVAVLLLPAGLALFSGLGCAVASLGWSGSRGRILLFAAALTGTEWLRGTVLTGFPWNNFGYALASDLQFAQGASVYGLYGLCFVALVTLASPAALFGTKGSRTVRLGPPLLAGLVLAGLWGAGAWRLAQHHVRFVPEVKLRLMQPDLPQDQKFRYGARDEVVSLYIDTSLGGGQEAGAGLEGITHLVWPESAFPFFLEREPGVMLRLKEMLSPGTMLITGAARAEPVAGQQRPDVYNSLRALGPDGVFHATADKVHLVPFGEYLPFQDTMEWLGFEQLTRQRGGFAAAPRRMLMNIPGLPPAVPLICYEAIFPGQVMPDALPGMRPGFLLNVSNDAWFGLTPGPYQHFEQARLRAVEEGVPLIRATNNGISAIVDPVGKTVGMLPLGVRGVLDGGLPEAGPPTIYSSIGSLIPSFMLIASVIVGTMLRRRYARLD